MPLDIHDKRAQLAFAFGDVIQRFTRVQPMTIEDILHALCFTAGHATAQKAAKKFATEKELRAFCLKAFDDGLTEGNRGGETPTIILPPHH
jgi:hypothetical protein